MDRDELLFRDGCRKWHARLERCADDGKLDEAQLLLRKIAQYAAAWKDSLATACVATREAERRLVERRRKEASIQSRLRMLRQLATAAERALAKQARLERKRAEQEKALVEEKAKKDAEKDRSGGDNE